jgi:hypothetical protein
MRPDREVHEFGLSQTGRRAQSVDVPWILARLLNEEATRERLLERRSGQAKTAGYFPVDRAFSGGMEIRFLLSAKEIHCVKVSLVP